MTKKKALLAVSFGTSYADTRDRTIGAIEQHLTERFPDREIFRAWTSGFIIKKVAREEGLLVDTPNQAMQRLAGYSPGLQPFLALDMRLGEGSGCPIAFEVIRGACDVMRSMATFEEADINDDYLEEVRAGGCFG